MICIDNVGDLNIGRLLDNKALVIEFDLSRWLRDYPFLTDYHIEVRNPDGMDYIPAHVTRDDDILSWEITAAETAASGRGEYRIVARGKDGERKSSATGLLRISGGLSGFDEGEPPEPMKPYVDEVLDAAKRAEEAAERAENTGVQDEHIAEVAMQAVKPLVTWENLPDKPFGRIEYAGIVLNNEHVTFSEGLGTITKMFRLKERGVYDVIWNSVAYTCTGVTIIFEGYEVVWLGNLGVLGAPDMGNPDAPFVIGCGPEEALEEMGAIGIVYALDGTEEIYLSISARDTVAPLEESVIPESIARLKQVEEMIDAMPQGGAIKPGKNLYIAEDGTLNVDTADAVEQDNTRPITSAAVHTTVGNIEILLGTI